MPLLTAPNTLAIGQALVGYGQNLAYVGGALVYKAVTLGENKDITDAVANGGACLEVYANQDDSQHKEFGGRVKDTQSWFLLSLVSLDDAQAAEALIYQVRDALVQPIQEHATLGNAGSVFHSQIKPRSGMFRKWVRNGQYYRAHLIEVLTFSEWQVTPGVIS